jgi:hypothetical protein
MPERSEHVATKNLLGCTISCLKLKFRGYVLYIKEKPHAHYFRRAKTLAKGDHKSKKGVNKPIYLYTRH